MKKAVLVFALSALVAPLASAQVIITEVVDGDLAEGTPKWFEITNVSGAEFTFGAGDGIIVNQNGPGSTTAVDIDLEGLTLGVNQVWVISDGSSADEFETAYGFAPDGTGSVSVN